MEGGHISLTIMSWGALLFPAVLIVLLVLKKIIVMYSYKYFLL